MRSETLRSFRAPRGARTPVLSAPAPIKVGRSVLRHQSPGICRGSPPIHQVRFFYSRECTERFIEDTCQKPSCVRSSLPVFSLTKIHADALPARPTPAGAAHQKSPKVVTSPKYLHSLITNCRNPHPSRTSGSPAPIQLRRFHSLCSSCLTFVSRRLKGPGKRANISAASSLSQAWPASRQWTD